MSNRVRLRITGLQELRHAVKAYGDALVRESVAAVEDAVDDTVLMARHLAPVGTYSARSGRVGGTLRDSIRGTVKTDGYAVRGTVRAHAPHAHLIEFGTQRIKRKPFLIPPAIRNRKRLNAALRAAVLRHAPDGLGRPRITGEGPATPVIGIG